MITSAGYLPRAARRAFLRAASGREDMRVSLLRRLATLATTLGLTSLGLLGAGAAPAQAAVSDCPAGYFCAWKTDDGTGTMFKTNTSQATLGAWDNTFR